MFKPRTITHNQNSLTLYPERWGIITSMKIRNIEILYQDMLDETLQDITKSVRWGIPILFPNAGFLTDEQKSETLWNLPQHGFARTSEWTTLQESYNSITQSLSSSDVPNMFGYKWSGAIENTIMLSEDSVELRYSIANNSDSSLPISLGLHPYWNIPLWDKSAIDWDFVWGDLITSDIDNWSRGGTTRIDIPYYGIVRFKIPGIGTIELQLSPDFRRLWIWSLEGRDFVCVEPVMWDDGNIVKNPVRILAGGKNESWIKVVLK